MNDQTPGPDMELSSGIAAFEAKHFSRATALLSPLADAGNPEAQYRMAIMAQNGLGMHENPLLAFKYMREAAEAGHPLAQHGLGFMYMEGDCVEADGIRAAQWFEKAAEQGLVGSMTTLAMLYEEGKAGLPKDPEKAREWYHKAGFTEK